MARSAAFGSKVVILDEPTAALGVKEGNRVLQLIRDVRDRGLPVILISHNMPHVFEVADRIHIQRLGRRATVITPKSHSMSEAVAIMTGAAPPPAVADGYGLVRNLRSPAVGRPAGDWNRHLRRSGGRDRLGDHPQRLRGDGQCRFHRRQLPGRSRRRPPRQGSPRRGPAPRVEHGRRVGAGDDAALWLFMPMSRVGATASSRRRPTAAWPAAEAAGGCPCRGPPARW